MRCGPIVLLLPGAQAISVGEQSQDVCLKDRQWINGVRLRFVLLVFGRYGDAGIGLGSADLVAPELNGAWRAPLRRRRVATRR